MKELLFLVLLFIAFVIAIGIASRMIVKFDDQRNPHFTTVTIILFLSFAIFFAIQIGLLKLFGLSL